MNDKAPSVTDAVTIPDNAQDLLKQAYEGSYYFIAGAGGPLQDWVTGYNEIMRDEEMGIPAKWFLVLGGDVNKFARHKYHGEIRDTDEFQHDLRCLLFPLDDLNIGKLAIFKIKMQDRWFDDVINNMGAR